MGNGNDVWACCSCCFKLGTDHRRTNGLFWIDLNRRRGDFFSSILYLANCRSARESTERARGTKWTSTFHTQDIFRRLLQIWSFLFPFRWLLIRSHLVCWNPRGLLPQTQKYTANFAPPHTPLTIWQISASFSQNNNRTESLHVSYFVWTALPARISFFQRNGPHCGYSRWVQTFFLSPNGLLGVYCEGSRDICIYLFNLDYFLLLLLPLEEKGWGMAGRLAWVACSLFRGGHKRKEKSLYWGTQLHFFN